MFKLILFNNNLKAFKFLVIKRFVCNGKSPHVARAIYHTFQLLTSGVKVIGMPQRYQQEWLIEHLLYLSLDHTRGAPQHKTTFLKQITNHQFPFEYFSNSYLSVTGHHNVLFKKGVLTDLRVLDELPVIAIYRNTHGHGLRNITLTGDSVIANFHAQKQTNPDCIVDIDGQLIRPLDIKSGMDMFKHTTRGTAGLLLFDHHTGENIQVMSSKKTSLDIYNFLDDVFQGIQQSSIHDSRLINIPPLTKVQENVLRNLSEELKMIDKNNIDQVFAFNKHVQRELWVNFQQDPLYKRAPSFIFTERTKHSLLDEKSLSFQKEFNASLKDKEYNMDKISDRTEVFHAAFRAYKRHVDAEVIAKIRILEDHFGIKLNTKIMQLMLQMDKIIIHMS